ncbi:U-box domain-containing protein 70-like isoform X2 [Carex rostrata]
MAVQSSADKVFVALPETYEDGLSALSWVISYFPQDKTKIIITNVMVSPFKEGLYDPRSWINERDKVESVLNKYLSHCAAYKFRAEKLVHMADDIAEGIVQVIAQHGTKNLVMRSAADREMNSHNLTPAPTSEVRFHRNGGAEASSSRSTRSNSESTTEEMLQEATIKAENFEKIAEDIFGAHKEMAHLVNKLAKNLQQKEQEMRELKDIFKREKQEKDQLRREIEENGHDELLRETIEQIMEENDLLRSQRDEYFNQIQVANVRRLALEEQVSNFELVIKDLKVISGSGGDRIDSLQDDLYNLQQENDNLIRKVEELCIQKENMHYGSSSTSVNSEFSLQELRQGTQNFSESLKIGEGAFGPVYKGSLRRTTVAIKLLRSQSIQGKSQFQQEITILTKVRHPNLVTLMGSCSEVSALVYEYLSNGSLEDRLTCANNTPPLTWQARTRIIGEICLALIFLHSNKPHLVVHGDLKPENILLDTNLVSKLSDFGISRLLKQPDTNATAFFQTMNPAGTFSYMDPEYLSTGILTPKSDIYSLGIIILRLLTGKPPTNIAGQVENAMRNGILLSVIDESAGTWPFEQAKELAKISLRCAELSRSIRPDLVNEVWAVVEPLMKAASTYMEPQSRGSELGEESIPSHFICPINQEVMQNPCIAADGFTYESDAIRQWLTGGHNTSPMTNLPLPHRNLIQNHVLRSAIQEWLQQHPQS